MANVDGRCEGDYEWAYLLATDFDFYCEVCELRQSFERQNVHEDELVPVVAVALGIPSRWPDGLPPAPSALAKWKLPGMGPILASEFLRNLHWNGFKPDRHIKRLFR